MKSYKFLYILLFIGIVCLILMTCGCLSSFFSKKYPDVLYKECNVVKIEYRTINGIKTAIVYQVKSNVPEFSYDLDMNSKRDIGMITYYVFKNTDVEEVQIICYYAGGGGLQPYYKFKIDRRNAKLSGLLDASENELPSEILYDFNKLKALGDLWINTRLRK